MAGSEKTARGGASGTKRRDGSLTREHFCIREFRIAAKLRSEGATDEEIVNRTVSENLFQYKAKSSMMSIARAMCLRLAALDDEGIIEIAADGPSESAIQLNLYAMMQVYPLVEAFMLEEIAPRYRSLDYTLTRADVNAFITRYQVAHPETASWTDKTTQRISAMLREMLADSGLLASSRSEELLPFALDSALREAILRHDDTRALAAFSDMEAF